MKPRQVGLWSLWRRLMGLAPDLEQPCPFCHEIDRLELACPRCREPLAGETAALERRMIAVIGSNAAGKTHFMATVLHRFLEGHIDGWEVRMSPEALERCRRELLNPLFEEGRELAATPAVLGPDFPVEFENQNTGDKALLVFRDVGGEALISPERLKELDFLHYADGVVLMVDPLAYRPPLDATENWVRHDKAPVTKVLKVYREVLQQRRRLEHDRGRSLLPRQKFLAVTVTKADLVLRRDHSFWDTNGDGSEYGAGYWAARSEKSRAVRDWIENNLGLKMARLTEDFADVSYFFVSSFGNGHSPGKQVLVQRPEPRRVHEPILALLDRLGEEAASTASTDDDDEL
jgi:hypothetical protein